MPESHVHFSPQRDRSALTSGLVLSQYCLLIIAVVKWCSCRSYELNRRQGEDCSSVETSCVTFDDSLPTCDSL